MVICGEGIHRWQHAWEGAWHTAWCHTLPCNKQRTAAVLHVRGRLLSEQQHVHVRMCAHWQAAGADCMMTGWARVMLTLVTLGVPANTSGHKKVGGSWLSSSCMHAANVQD